MLKVKKLKVNDPGVDWKEQKVEIYVTKDDNSYVLAIPIYTYATQIQKGEAIKLDKFPSQGDMKEIEMAIAEAINEW